MDIELTDLEEILLYLETTSLEPHNDYTSEFTYKDQKILYKYIKELQQENDKLKEQQKGFIKYLENGIDICDGFLDTVKSDLQEIPYGVISAGKTYITTRIKENETVHKVYKEILQKYRKIIGDDK